MAAVYQNPSYEKLTFALRIGPNEDYVQEKPGSTALSINFRPNNYGQNIPGVFGAPVCITSPDGAEYTLRPFFYPGENVFRFEDNGISIDIRVLANEETFISYACTYKGLPPDQSVVICNQGIAFGRIPILDLDRAVLHHNRVRHMLWAEARVLAPLEAVKPVITDVRGGCSHESLPQNQDGHERLNKAGFVPLPGQTYTRIMSRFFHGLEELMAACGYGQEVLSEETGQSDEAPPRVDPEQTSGNTCGALESSPPEALPAGDRLPESALPVMTAVPDDSQVPLEEQMKLKDRERLAQSFHEERIFWRAPIESLPDIDEYLSKANLPPAPDSNLTLNANKFAGIVRDVLKSTVTKLIDRIEMYYTDPEAPLTDAEMMHFRDLIYYVMGGLNCHSAETSAVSYRGGQEKTPTGVLAVRKKIKPDAFIFLYEEFTRELRNSDALRPLFHTMFGYIIAAVDGTDVNLLRNIYDEETYCSSGKGRKAYNQIHLNCIYDCLNCIYLAAQYSGRKKAGRGERKALYDMLSSMAPKDLAGMILTADRGYESHEALVHLLKSGCKFIIRTKSSESNGILGAFPGLRANGDSFQVWTRYYISKKAQPEGETSGRYCIVRDYDCLDEDEVFEVSLRILQFRLPSGEIESLVTNIPMWELSPYHLYCIYSRRWGIEVSYRMFKFQVSVKQQHSIKPEYVRQELWAKLLMFNYASFIMSHTSIPETRRKQARKYDYAIKRSRGIVLCRRLLVGNISLDEFAAKLVQRLQPIRPGRSYPRNVRPQSVQSSQTMGTGM